MPPPRPAAPAAAICSSWVSYVVGVHGDIASKMSGSVIWRSLAGLSVAHPRKRTACVPVHSGQKSSGVHRGVPSVKIATGIRHTSQRADRSAGEITL
jgi:hypothetical protein